MYQYLLTGTVLLFCSVTDIKYRRVYKTAVAVYYFLGLLGHLPAAPAVLVQTAAGLLPGACCLVLSWLSREGLGYGDSALILGCGLSLGLWDCLSVLFSAMLLSGIWAAGLLMTRRAGRKKEIPFVPFLFFGLLVQCGGLIL